MTLSEGDIFPLKKWPDKLNREAADTARIFSLREKINDEEYLHGAIQRIAMILSNEITAVKFRPPAGPGSAAEPGEGKDNERKGR
ncbi:MAG: hypothetical protein LBQ44_02570 [Treponema sp.]|jgi:hypothetical protein|nr:hypothetical protein [Treponema sp.]